MNVNIVITIMTLIFVAQLVKSNPELCDYQGTCNVGGVQGVCVSISSGCCSGGTVTAGLCPGSTDIRCCTSHTCSTPKGNGICKQTSSCSGTPVPGYCTGPTGLQCCVGSTPPSACTLESAIQSASSDCDSYTISAGLTNQIVAEMKSMGHTFRELDGTWVRCPGFKCTLQSGVASRLESAAKSKNDFITLNSAWRSSAEQFILYQWYKRGICKGMVSLAAAPGQSNHEGGRAIDTSFYNYWTSTLSRFGWTHPYENDQVHFDYPSATDLRSENLKAFQRLWNRKNPSQKITEDGIYGPQTESALKRAPCGGW